jgi:hypothetical protein
MNAGFGVVVLVAVLLVVWPAAVLLRAAWRKGRAGRTLVVLAVSAAVLLAALLLAPSSWPASLDERVLLLLGAWALLFAGVGVLAGAAALLKWLWRARRSGASPGEPRDV